MTLETGSFESFAKIQHLDKLYMTITEKIHGSNAQIYIYKDQNDEVQLKVGSRSRWLVPGDDNFGFAQFVYDNKEEIILKLGYGRHYGEWCGLGINGGYNLPEKRLYLFNWRRFRSRENELPNRILTVPVLSTGNMSPEAIGEAMNDLQENGSRVSPGYMRPEGIVVELDGNFYKKTFDIEEIKWTGKDPNYVAFEPRSFNVDYLLQPIRLKKLLSKDSRYLENFPKSMREIFNDYVQDLEEENQIIGNEDEVNGIKKALGSQVFYFIKTVVAEIQAGDI